MGNTTRDKLKSSMITSRRSLGPSGSYNTNGTSEEVALVIKPDSRPATRRNRKAEPRKISRAINEDFTLTSIKGKPIKRNGLASRVKAYSLACPGSTFATRETKKATCKSWTGGPSLKGSTDHPSWGRSG